MVPQLSQKFPKPEGNKHGMQNPPTRISGKPGNFGKIK
jgi:hypothetical protein